MWLVIMIIAISILTSYITTKIICGHFTKCLDEIEKEHRKALLGIAQDFISKK